MSETIKDGKGRGYLVEINENQQIMSNSVIRTEEAEVALSGYSFVASTNVLTLNSLNPHMILYMKNTNSIKNLTFWVVNIGWNGGSTNHNRTLRWAFVVMPNTPTANHTIVTPGNLNLTSNNVAELTSYKWDGVGDGMTYTGGGVGSEQIIDKGTTLVPLEGLPILGLNDAIAIVVTGEEVGDVSLSTRLYFK